MWNHRLHVQQARAAVQSLDASETGDLLAFLFALGYWDADAADGDARAGSQLFVDKKCVVCHQKIAGAGGVVGPGLDSFRQHNSPILLAAIMWNHGPQMGELMQATGIERPVFRGTELRDLVAYLKSASAAATEGKPLHLLPGDGERGRRIFGDKQCLECHREGRLGLKAVGRGTGRSLTDLAAAMWNKTPAMTAMMKRRAISLSPLRGDEMADLVAYLHALGYLTYPGDARKGQKLAADKGCLVCHSASDLSSAVGAEFARPGRQAPTTMISFAWNHALLMDRAPAQAVAAWRPLAGDEMWDLMAFVRGRGEERPRDGTYPGTVQAP